MTFEQLYYEHQSKVFNLCLQYTQNCEDAEELTQDVFVKINASLKKFQNNSQISTWIYRITVNTCLDFLKSKLAKKRFAYIKSLFNTNNEVVYDQVQFDHPGVQLENKEKIRRIFSVINKLPPNQKTALILSKIEQKSIAETADIMQISIKAAESLVQRAKTNILNKLNEAKENN